MTARQTNIKNEAFLLVKCTYSMMCKMGCWSFWSWV